MNFDAIAKIAELLVKAAPILIKGVQDAKPFAELLFNTLAKGNKVTEKELDILEARIADLSNQLQKPLDPE